MPTISVGNSRIKYRVTGSGPALALVHGVGKGGESALGHLVDRFGHRPEGFSRIGDALERFVVDDHHRSLAQ